MVNRTPLIHTFLEKNTHINLSALRDEESVFLKHIQDSLEVNKVLTFSKGTSVADLWTGGGFPLLPLAMTHPDVTFTGIDSVKKKVVAVNEIISSLSITNVNVVRSRIEAFKKQTFEYATARAVAYVDKLIPWAYPLLKVEGTLVLMKQKHEEEKAELLHLCKQRHLQFMKEHTYTLFPWDIKRTLYIVKKK